MSKNKVNKTYLFSTYFLSLQNADSSLEKSYRTEDERDEWDGETKRATPLSSADIVPMGRETPQGIIGQTPYSFPYCGEHYPLAAKVEQKYNKIANDYDYDFVARGYNQILFLREAIKKAGSTEKEKMIDAAEGLEFETTVGRIKVLKYSHRATVPLFIGTTTYSPKYPFAVLKDVKTYQGEKFMYSEDQVRKMRGE